MKFYISASCKDKKLAEQIADHLELLGHEITFPWYYYVTDDEREFKKAFNNDVQGVLDCEKLIILHTGENTLGKSFEYATGYHAKKEILVFGKKFEGPFQKATTFFHAVNIDEDFVVNVVKSIIRRYGNGFNNENKN